MTAAAETVPGAAAPAAPPPVLGRVRRRTVAAFLAPAVIALLAVGIVPLIYAVWRSLYDFNLTRVARTRFVGLDNYATVLTDPTFWAAMRRTAFLFVTAVPVQIALGLLIALLLHRPGLGMAKALTRLALVLPMATTYAVVGLLAQVTMNQRYGVFNQMLGWVGLGPVNILGNPQNAFWAVVFWDVWQWTPFVALVLLAGLSTVPPEVEEAARLETRSHWTILRHVQLPFLIPSLVAVLILRTADTLKLFDMVFTMTRGGPGNATEFIAILIERTGNRQFNIGMASAQAIVLLVITIVLARLYVRLFYRET
ncbi:carbohydrate ABC transporter permease [Rubellimicrobium sp. CFH 75288]|uniref:carbohydrate ABC transporter permease n=1 Tax=Rubellimicrobium sp. CFH 75288 TaxID=2697034 RepID=UPI0014131F54|nr:sugar ABC transporter permease [Rubellimicrobium sp. CFH 75288]NAZ36098.1 ABC transporter permease subunit [Rubellimicrobium sp. CFH 75288]